MTPAASVIITTLNRSSILKEAMDSVLSQDFSDFELIIVDDGSEDATEVIVRNCKDSRIRYVKRPNGGISAARNTGIFSSKGNWICFLDDDDRPLTGWLSSFAQLMADPSVGIGCVGAIRNYAQRGSSEVVLPRRLRSVYESVFGLFMTGTFAARTSLLKEVGGFAEALTCSHASELAMRLIPACHRKGFQVRSIEKPYVQINREDGPGRLMRRPAHLLKGTTYILETHNDILKRSPDSISRYLAIAGVAALRLGMYKDSRKFFLNSLLAYPWSIKPYFRFFMSLNRHLAQRFWRISDFE